MPGPGTRRAFQEKVEALRREQILDAATEVFAQRGFRTAGIQQVAEAAGIAKGTVYNYFDSKDDLLLALLDRLNESEDRPAQFEKLVHGDPRQMMAALMLHRFEFLSEQKELFRALLPELLSNRKLRQRYLRRVVGPSMRLAEEALSKLGHGNPAHLARAMAAGLLGLVVLDLLGEPGSSESAPQIVNVQSDAFSSLLEASADR